jgi:hypothetical protein
VTGQSGATLGPVSPVVNVACPISVTAASGLSALAPIDTPCWGTVLSWSRGTGVVYQAIVTTPVFGHFAGGCGIMGVINIPGTYISRSVGMGYLGDAPAQTSYVVRSYSVFQWFYADSPALVVNAP